MTKYEEIYGKGWEQLDDDQAMERAYALGVAASLGEYHRDELDALREEMNSAYKRSVIDLAYEEGRTEAKEADASTDTDEAVWNELVIGEEVDIEPEESKTGGRTGLPEAIDVTEALELPDRDSTDSLELPEFLKDN